MITKEQLPTNFKVRVKDEEHSRMIQQWLFDNDVAVWCYGWKVIKYEDCEFLFVEDGLLTYNDDEYWFLGKETPEVVFDVIQTVSPRLVEKEQEVEIMGKTYIVKDKNAFEEALKNAGIVEKK